MSEESAAPELVELVHELTEAANSRSYDAYATLLAPQCVCDLSHLGLGSHNGFDAVRRFVEEWIGAYEEYEIAVEGVHDLGNGVLLTMNLQKARPHGSSAHVSLQDAYVFLVEDGKVVRWTPYPDRDEGRAAAERLAESRA
jgi:limonene-1,2-epoxide hydrolase